MPDRNQASSADLYNNFFNRQSWPEPWDSSAFSPDQERMKFYNRVKSKPSQSLTERFISYYLRSPENWPWGFFIYRTTYGSDEEWNQALAKLYRHIGYTIRHEAILDDYGPDQPEDGLTAAEFTSEGCYNVIVEDRELLDGASPAQVRQLFNEWLKRNPKYNHHGNPRSSFCLMIDNHALRSILASSEPCLNPRDWTPHQPGYVIIIDRSFPDRGGIRWDEYNVGWMRLSMGGIWLIWRHASTYDDLVFDETYPAIGRPGLIPYYDGYWHWVEDVNGQKVENPNSSGDTDDEEDEDVDDDEDGYTEEGGYPVHDIYEYLREGGHI